MRTLTLSLLLSLSSMLEFGRTVSAAVSLSVRPNLQQFHGGDAVYLSCGDGGRTARRTSEGRTPRRTSETRQCGKHVGSSCFISFLSPSDSGLYWCETSDGQSEQVNITVTSDRPLILEIPALPVTAGSEVTLRCRTKDDGSAPAAYFFKNGVHVGGKTSVSEQQTLSEVQASDEGFYSCSTDTLQSSPQSWLRVKGSSPTAAPPPSPSAPPPYLLRVSGFRLLCHLVVVGLFCVSSVLMVLRCCSRKTGNKLTVKESDDITDDITDDVITEHNF